MLLAGGSLMYGFRALIVYEALEASLFSSAYCCTAPSSWRRLLMHAFIWDCVRARTKLGMAMAANNPMMATTIMISTSVKPDLFDALIFILTLCFSNGGVNSATGGLY